MSFNDGGLYKYLLDSNVAGESIFYLLFALIVIVSSYLLGSINSAIIVSKTMYKDDIRNHGSGNAGLTNMLRTYGLGAAALTLLGDMLKTALAIFFTSFFLGISYSGGISLGGGYCYLAGLSAVLGHVYPIFYGFKGGKGVLATATMALILTPVPFAILILTFIVIVFFSRYVSLGSICVALLYPVTVVGYVFLRPSSPAIPLLTVICSIILAVFIVWCHRSNIKRIIDGSERKISIGGKKKKDE